MMGLWQKRKLSARAWWLIHWGMSELRSHISDELFRDIPDAPLMSWNLLVYYNLKNQGIRII